MNSLLLISFVMVSLFDVNTESKDFCQAFKENGYKVDYLFNMEYLIREENRMFAKLWNNDSLVIGSSYWFIDDPEHSSHQNIKLESNESRENDFFAGYSLVFGCEVCVQFMRGPDSEYYTFINKTDLSIEFKRVTFDGRPSKFNITDIRTFETAFNHFNDFEPSLSFYSGEYGKGLLYIPKEGPEAGRMVHRNAVRRTFVSQKRVNTAEELYERQYFSLRIQHKEKWNDTYDQQIFVAEANPNYYIYKLPNTTQGHNLLVGISNIFGTQHTFVQYFYVHKSIKYCNKEVRNKFFDLDSECLHEPRVLIDCSEGNDTEKGPFPLSVQILIVLGVLFVCVLVLGLFLGIIVCIMNWSKVSEFLFTKSQINTEKGSQQKPNTGNAVRDAVENTTIVTVDSETGEPVPSISAASFNSSTSSTTLSGSVQLQNAAKYQSKSETSIKSKNVSPKVQNPKK